MKSKIDFALKKLAAARKRLSADQGRISRRNARTAVLKALRSVRRAMNAEYPKIRPATVEQPAPIPLAKPPKLRLPFIRSFIWKEANLFVDLCSDRFRFNRPKMEMHGGAVVGTYNPGVIWLNPEWPDRVKWLHVVNHFGYALERHGGEAKHAFELWEKFWSEQLPTTDVRLAAEQLDMIERRRAHAAKLAKIRGRS